MERHEPSRDQRTINELSRLIEQIEHVLKSDGKGSGLEHAVEYAREIVTRAPDQAVAKLANAVMRDIELAHPLRDGRSAYLFRGMLWRLKMALELCRRAPAARPTPAFPY